MDIFKLQRANDIQQELKWLKEERNLITEYKSGRVAIEYKYEHFKAINFLDKEMEESIKQQIIDYIDKRVERLKQEFDEL